MRFALAALLSLVFAGFSASAQERGYGFIPAPADKYGSIPEALPPLIGSALPTSVDLSDDMPPPGDQGNQNSCVAWAVAYALKSQQEKIERNWPLYGPSGINADRVFSPSFVYNQINQGQDNGSTFGDALRVLTTQGAAPLSAMPYTNSPFEPVPPAARTAAADFRIDTFRSLDPSNTQLLKSQLAAGFPIVFAGRMYRQFEQLGPGETWTQASGPVTGRHAMTLVGYDDSRNAFKVINSWSQNWGSNGYGWIDYDLFGLVIDEAYLVVDLKGDAAEPAEVPVDEWTPPAIRADNSVLAVTNVAHNQFDASGAVGVVVNGTATVPAGVRGQAQVVIGLTFQNGMPVGSLSPAFAFANGQAAFGTPPLPLDGSGVVNLPWYAFMPYCALDVPKTRLCVPYPNPFAAPVQSNLRASPALFIDGFGVAQGPALDFFVAM